MCKINGRRKSKGLVLILMVLFSCELIGYLEVNDAVAQAPIKIGVLHPLSGPFAAAGIETVRGAEIAFEESGGKIKVLGRELQMIVRDDETNPAVGVRRARELIEKEDIKFLTGNVSTAVCLAVMKVAEEKKVPYLACGSGDEITGSQCNRYTFRYTAFSTLKSWTTVLPMIQKMKAKTFYAIVVDYSMGRTELAAAEDVIKQEGAKLLGTSLFPLGETDFSNHISKAMATKPDVIVCICWGRDTAQLARQLRQFNANVNSKILFTGFDITDFKAIGCENLKNAYMGVHWWFEHNDPVSKNFVKRYRDKFGSIDNIGAPSIGGYIDINIIAQAINAAGSTDPEKILKAMVTEEFVNLYGQKSRFEPFNHQGIRPYIFARAKTCEEKKGPMDHLEILDEKVFYEKKEKSACNFEK